MYHDYIEIVCKVTKTCKFMSVFYNPQFKGIYTLHGVHHVG